MNERTEPTKLYEVVINRFVDQIQSMESSHLIRHYRLGKLTSEFTASMDSGHYGRGASMKQLADDLNARGVLLNIVRPVKILYSAQAIFRLHTSEQELTKLSERGYTVSHAKIVLALPEDERQDFAPRMTGADGRFLSIRAIIDELRPTHPQLSVDQEQDVQVDRPPAGPLPEEPIKPARAAKQPVDQPVSPPAADNPALPTPAPGEHRAAPTIQTPPRPVAKTLKGMDAVLTDLMVCITDTLLIINHTGADYGPTLRRNRDTLMNIRQASISSVEALQGLIPRLDDEIRALTDIG